MQGPKEIPHNWGNWTFKDEVLIDPNGNRYTRQNIEALFWLRQIDGYAQHHRTAPPGTRLH